jgi:predicted negative regulator of RcsB-dependent stress response
MRAAFLFILVLAGPIAHAAATATTSPFDDAVAAAEGYNFRRAETLFREAAKIDTDPRRRDLARIRLASIQWRIEHQPAEARKTLAAVGGKSEQAALAWVERARIDAELLGDFAAARADAQHAVAAVRKPEERMGAVYVQAYAEVEPVRRARLAHRCTQPSFAREAMTELHTAIEQNGPLLEHTRLLLDAALIVNDGPAALAAWRSYYRLSPEIAPPALLAGPAATLQALLPSWKDATQTPDVRRRVGLALADSRLFDEAALVLSDPCASHPLPARDRETAGVVRYAASLRKIAAIADEYYRQVALGRGNADRFKRDVTAAELPELEQRFGALVNIGNTGGILDLHLAHAVLDERRTVHQYGRTAELHFVSLDGVVSNGFGTWARDHEGGDGGWATDEVIYQVRPMYADGPLRDWQRVTNASMQKEADRRIAEETARDVERAAREGIRDFPGLTLRLRRQYETATLEALKGKGLSGDALRDAFLARVTDDTFESSIWAHEGRHAIDRKYGLATEAADLEYRAKLSEVAFAPAPRSALIGSIVGGMIGTNTPHGIADKRALEGVTGWMRAHAADVAGLEIAKPLLPQLDKLTDAQLREAFRSIDPLAAAPKDAP